MDYFSVFIIILHNEQRWKKLKIVEIFVQKKCFYVLHGVHIFGILAV